MPVINGRIYPPEKSIIHTKNIMELISLNQGITMADVIQIIEANMHDGTA